MRSVGHVTAGFAIGLACLLVFSWPGLAVAFPLVLAASWLIGRLEARRRRRDAERDQAHVIPLPPCARNGHYPAQMKSARRR